MNNYISNHPPSAFLTPHQLKKKLLCWNQNCVTCKCEVVYPRQALIIRIARWTSSWSDPSYILSFQFYSCLFLHDIGFSNILYLGFNCICFCFGLSKAFQRVNLTEAFALLICRYYFLNGIKYFLRLLVQIFFFVRTGAYMYVQYVLTYQSNRILLSL